MHCSIEKKMLFCPMESWRRFEKVVVDTIENEKSRKRVREVYKETNPLELVDYVKKILATFINHNFVARWQDAQAKLEMENLGEGQILSHIDFSENYTFQPQNEVQSEYYHSFTITIFIQIMYHIILNANKTRSKVVKEQHFYISDDTEHDTLFVQHCLREHSKWLDEHGITFKEHIVFSDGPLS